MTPDEIKAQAEEVAHRVWDEQSDPWDVYSFGAECFRRGMLAGLEETWRRLNNPNLDEKWSIGRLIAAIREAGK